MSIVMLCFSRLAGFPKLRRASRFLPRHVFGHLDLGLGPGRLGITFEDVGTDDIILSMDVFPHEVSWELGCLGIEL